MKEGCGGSQATAQGGTVVAVRRALTVGFVLLLGIAAAVGTEAQSDEKFLTGHWDTTFDIKIVPPAVIHEVSFRNELSVSYRLGEATTIGALAAIQLLPISFPVSYARSYMTLSGNTRIGAATLDSKAHFSLDDMHFTHWVGDFVFNILGVETRGTLLLVNNAQDPTPADLLLDLGLRGQAVNGMSFDAVATFGTYVPPVAYRSPPRPYGPWPHTGDTDGICDLPFQRFALAVRNFEFCCGGTYSIDLSLDCEGFEKLEFTTQGITIARLPWLVIDARLEFELQKKTLTLAPRVDLGKIGCDFEMRFRLDQSGGSGPDGDALSIDALVFDVLMIQCTIGGLMTRAIVQSRGAMVLTVAASEGTCCGPLAFAGTIVFSGSNDSLFDVRSYQIRTAISFLENYTLTLGMSADLKLPATTWTLGFGVSW
jgi:hypothetical protein